MNNAERLQQVLDTLQQIELRASYDNMNHMLGCLQVLSEIRDSVRAIEEKQAQDDNVNVEVIDGERAD